MFSEFVETFFMYKELFTEAAVQRCFLEKVFWKYAANLQQTTYAKVRFQ